MHQECESYTATIFIAGDYNIARDTCRKFCYEQGLCVTIEPTTYIYTGGEEAGVRIGLINYPRFPAKDVNDIYLQAHRLACKLLIDLCQHSFSVQTPDKTVWYTRREQV